MLKKETEVPCIGPVDPSNWTTNILEMTEKKKVNLKD